MTCSCLRASPLFHFPGKTFWTRLWIKPMTLYLKHLLADAAWWNTINSLRSNVSPDPLLLLQMVPTTWRWTQTRDCGQGKCSPSTPESWSSLNARLTPTHPTATFGSLRAAMPPRSSMRARGWRCAPINWPRLKSTCAAPSTTWRRSRTRPSSLWWWPNT